MNKLTKNQLDAIQDTMAEIDERDFKRYFPNFYGKFVDYKIALTRIKVYANIDWDRDFLLDKIATEAEEALNGKL
jgi:hypothetical protein